MLSFASAEGLQLTLQVKYVYRHYYSTRPNPKRKVHVQMDIVYPDDQPLQIYLDEGREVGFGKGTTAAEWPGGGPLPEFCKLRLSVSRIMRLSGAGDLFLKLTG